MAQQPFPRAGARAVVLGGPKFEFKYKSRCLQKIKLVNWGTKHVDWGGQAPLHTQLLVKL